MTDKAIVRLRRREQGRSAPRRPGPRPRQRQRQGHRPGHRGGRRPLRPDDDALRPDRVGRVGGGRGLRDQRRLRRVAPGGRSPRTLLAWGDRVRVLDRTTTKVEVEVTDFKEQPDGSIRPVAASGFLKRRLRVDGANRQGGAARRRGEGPAGRVRRRPAGRRCAGADAVGKLITIDGGENQLFARFLAGRLRGTSPAARRPIDAVVVTHGDADHFAGLSRIRQSETEEGLADHKRLFIHPQRVFHNGLVKRPDSVPELERLGPTKKAGGRTILTGLHDNPLDVPASGMNRHFKAWRKALEGWQAAGPIEFRRLARGTDDAFDFLAEDGIAVEVLGPPETHGNVRAGLSRRAQGGQAARPSRLRAWFPERLPHDQRALRRAPPPVRERPDAVRRRPQQRRRGGAPGRARGRANRPGVGGAQGPPPRLPRVCSGLPRRRLARGLRGVLGRRDLAHRVHPPARRLS